MAGRDRSRDGSRRSVPERFESFGVSIERVRDVYKARVTVSPVGRRPRLELDPAGLEAPELEPSDAREPLRDVNRRQVDRAAFRHVGERLFRTVFRDEIGETYRASLERVRSAGAGLRIRLQLDEAPELATLPWEALWDPTEREFLAALADVVLVRAFDVAAGAPSEVAPPPMRLVALLPEPRGEAKLGGVAEWELVQEKLAPLLESGRVVA